jgi:tetratricopeptide (TPR) repeat protein/predicted Ser/Thr protein kinase
MICVDMKRAASDLTMMLLMDPDAMALFHELADRSPAEREDHYVQWQVPAEVRAEVESLLRFDGTSGHSLSGYVAAAAEDALVETDAVPPGSRYGSYRVVRLLGRGGMGAVYEAEQASPRRVVALKVIKAGLASPELVRRFKQESQALGRLQHPGIAQIYEAGTADTRFGPQPFFAMELVRGEPLLQYAESHHLRTRERLELMARICEAVHHAHQRGIIHRDLKPGNILVDETGQPRILDFGVARVTDSDVQATRQTDVGQLIGTLAYMSPEQVLADPLEVDTRSDVYALGMILYELLAKRLPYNTTGNLHEVVHAIREEDPTRLGTVDRAYRGDIETIVAKALEKEKTRRYGSVTALSEDIRRYLQDEPIVARRPGTVYQLQKFARRNKALVAGVAAVFVALVAGVIVSTWQAARARRAEQAAAQEAATAKAINDFLQHDLLAQAGASTQAKPGTKPDPDLKVRTALDRAAATITGRFDRQPAIEASIRNTIGQTYSDLGLYAQAQRQLEQALDLQKRTLPKDHPDTLSTMSTLAGLYISNGKPSQGEPLAVHAAEARRRTLGADHPDTLASLFTLADLYRMQNKSAKAEPILLSLVQALRRVKGDEHPDTLDSQQVLAIVYRLQGKYIQAEPLLRHVLEVRRRVQGDEHPDTLRTMNDLVTLYGSMGRYPQAEALAFELVQTDRRVLGPEHSSTLVGMYELALQYVRQGKYALAEPLLIQALEAERRILGEDSARTLNMMTALGSLFVEEGKYVDAEPMLGRVIAVRRRVLGDENPDTLTTLSVQAQLYRSRGDYAPAEALLGNVQQIRLRVLGAQHPSTLSGGNDFGVLYLVQGKYEQAEAAFGQALAGRRRVLGDDHPDTLASMIGLVESELRQGKYAEAEPLSLEAMQRYEKTRPENWRRHKAQSLRGGILAGQKRYAEAEPLLLAGYQGLIERETTIPAADRPAIEQAAERVFQLYQRWGQPEKAARWRLRSGTP